MGKSLENTARELRLLNRMAEALNREVDLPRALQVALANIVELFNMQTGWIFLKDEESDRFYTAATIALPPALSEHPRRMGGTCYCIDSYLEGDMEGAANINAIICTRLKGLREGTDGLRYHASIPLYAQGKELGILNVASADWQELSDDDLRLLHTVGDLMAIAIERARLFRRSADLGALAERNRLARDIHDTIAQGLVAIALKLEKMDLLLEAGAKNESLREVLGTALKLTRENLEEARRSVMDLRAAPLEGKSLAEAIESLLRKLAIHSEFEVLGSSPPIPSRLEMGAFRIIQEAISNIEKHAAATEVIVQLILTPDYLRVVIEDNGIGFEPHKLKEGHFGLIGMKERAKLLNARLDIVSGLASGTVIELLIPLETSHD